MINSKKNLLLVLACLNIPQVIPILIIGLKNKLLSYSHDEDNEFEDNLPKLKTLIHEIQQFSHEYKRKPKKSRRNTAEGKHILSSMLPKFDKFKCSSDI